jgi:hypothetical protein
VKDAPLRIRDNEAAPPALHQLPVHFRTLKHCVGDEGPKASEAASFLGGKPDRRRWSPEHETSERASMIADDKTDEIVGSDFAKDQVVEVAILKGRAINFQHVLRPEHSRAGAHLFREVE